jgi:hypothetical protein
MAVGDRRVSELVDRLGPHERRDERAEPDQQGRAGVRDLGIIAPDVEWARYAEANVSLHRARDPHLTGLIKMKASYIRKIGSLDVIHAPVPNNRAHSNIIGFQGLPKTKVTKLRLQLSMKTSWIIKPGTMPRK